MNGDVDQTREDLRNKSTTCPHCKQPILVVPYASKGDDGRWLTWGSFDTKAYAQGMRDGFVMQASVRRRWLKERREEEKMREAQRAELLAAQNGVSK